MGCLVSKKRWDTEKIGYISATHMDFKTRNLDRKTQQMPKTTLLHWPKDGEFKSLGSIYNNMGTHQDAQMLDAQTRTSCQSQAL